MPGSTSLCAVCGHTICGCPLVEDNLVTLRDFAHGKEGDGFTVTGKVDMEIKNPSQLLLDELNKIGVEEMRNVFGWSYPPGVNSVPGDGDDFCEMCWRDEVKCWCDSCPVCDDIGNPKCYMDRNADGHHHGLAETENQRAGRREAEEDFRLLDQETELVGCEHLFCYISEPEMSRRRCIRCDDEIYCVWKNYGRTT